MILYADLHLHSHYSRATSKLMNVLDMSKYARYKGLNLLGTGDFTHPLWLKELKSRLRPINGFYEFDGMLYVLQAEVASIYKHNGRVRKVHHVILAPDFEAVDKINSYLDTLGRRDYDGRPIFGCSSKDLVNAVINVSDKCVVIPAHIWTPWFSVFGSMSGYDSLEECYEDELQNIFTLETGLSSDPEMNWRLSKLDKYSLVSNSDSHSPWPWRMGRECNVFDIKPDYDSLYKALKTRKGFLKTIEVDPAYGKYHWDGHRNCNVSMSPNESLKLNNTCPVCNKPLTIGVEHRVEELADRPAGYKLEGAVPFIDLMPLAEIIAKFLNKGLNTKTVWAKYSEWIKKFGNEFNIMLETPENDLLSFDNKIGGAIIKVRNQKVKIKPGYDGEYGVPEFNNPSQKGLKSFF